MSAQVVPRKSSYHPTPTDSVLEVPWFARCVYTEEEVEMYPLLPQTKSPNHQKSANSYLRKSTDSLGRSSSTYYSGRSGSHKSGAAAAILPSDPRQWSREEVCGWVVDTCTAHNLPAPNTDRFLMNGKAVCLMSLNMFISRVPLGGKLLYRDFQIRLGQAIHC